jgi:hypothetical protein
VTNSRRTEIRTCGKFQSKAGGVSERRLATESTVTVEAFVETHALWHRLLKGHLLGWGDYLPINGVPVGLGGAP